jgi:hypothetical protein
MNYPAFFICYSRKSVLEELWGRSDRNGLVNIGRLVFNV